MSGKKVPEEYSAAGAPPGGHDGATAARPNPTGAAPVRGYEPPPGHHFALPHYVTPATQYPPGPQPPPPAAGGYAYQQQQQQPQQHQQQAYGMPQTPPVMMYTQPQHPVPMMYHPPPVMAPPPQAPQQWTTGLFDCGDDPSNCVITFFLPCITFGQIAEIIDMGTTSCLLAGSIWTAVLLFFGCPCFVSCLWRTKLRHKYNLPQDEIGDMCLHFWCESCALCQEYRELNNRGLNPALGWEYHRQQMYAQSMGAPAPVYMQR